MQKIFISFVMDPKKNILDFKNCNKVKDILNRTKFKTKPILSLEKKILDANTRYQMQ